MEIDVQTAVWKGGETACQGRVRTYSVRRGGGRRGNVAVRQMTRRRIRKGVVVEGRERGGTDYV
jgi:hypothetical protein